MKKYLLYGSLALVVVVLLGLSIAHYAFIWRGGQYFGVVQDSRKGYIIITDPREGSRTITLTPETKLLRGRTELGAIPKGAPVLVVTKKVEGGQLEATLVRIMETEEEAKNRPR